MRGENRAAVILCGKMTSTKLLNTEVIPRVNVAMTGRADALPPVAQTATERGTAR